MSFPMQKKGEIMQNEQPPLQFVNSFVINAMGRAGPVVVCLTADREVCGLNPELALCESLRHHSTKM